MHSVSVSSQKLFTCPGKRFVPTFVQVTTATPDNINYIVNNIMVLTATLVYLIVKCTLGIHVVPFFTFFTPVWTILLSV